MEVDKEPSMEPARQADFHDSITVARPRVPERDVFGSCAHCNAYLFIELNRWKRVSADYVMHTQRQSATSNIEGSMIKGENELDGSNELEGCKIVYLRCADCSQRLGLHCSQGTKTKKFSNIAMLRLKKIVLRDTKSTHQESHQVRFNIVDDIVSAAEAADSKTFENKQTASPAIDLASTADMMPIREKKNSNAAAAAAAAQNATGIDTGTASESCKVCKDKHMRCDKRWPTCITCETFGRKCHWLPDITIVASQPPSQASSKAVTKSASPAGPLAATTTTTTTTAAKKEPARGSWKQRSDLSPVDCGTCRMWHRDCDRSLPKCKFCIDHNRTCNYHGVKLNAIDQLDPKPVLNPNANLPIIGGGTDDEGDDEDDDDIMPIRPRSRQSPASISAFEYEKLRKTVIDQKATIEELEISYHSLLAKFATYKAETRSELKTLKKRQHTMEKALQKVILNFVSDPGQLAAMQDPKPPAFKGPVTTVPNRQIALAKRGGHRSPSSHKTFSTGVTPAKRLFDDHVMSTPNAKPSNSSNTFGRPSDPGGMDNRDVTVDAHPDFNSLYDATPPPRSTMMEQEEDQNMSDVNVPSSEQIQNNRLHTQADVSSSSSLRSQPIPDAVKIEDGSSSDASSEAETQAYLKRTVRDEDSEDEDFNPAGESIGPSQNTGPDTQLVAESVDRLLSPSRPLRATPKTRGSPGRPRGSSRGRGRPAKSPFTPHDGFEPFENMLQSNFVPSTPSTGADGARTSFKRRGYSGASRPVPTEFSHSAFSSSQAATMINDEPTPKRVKFGGTPVSYASVHSPKSAGGPASFAFKPPSGEKVSSRYPEGRIRDAEGYLLNKNGTRDRRSVRGKLLGCDAFRKQEDGGRRTVDSILTQRANEAAPAASSPLAQQSTVASPLRGSGGGSFSNQQQYHGQAPLATTLSNEIPATPSGPSFLPINMQTPTSMLPGGGNQDNAAHLSNGGGGNNNGQESTASPDQQDDDALATSRDVAMLAAEAERDRVAKAHAKGDNREWSNKHAAIWEKMGM